MALSPADFAAYSRATGTPYPEDPEERAQLAPEVASFRRDQLQAPKQESNLPGILGATALLFGAGQIATGIGLARALGKTKASVASSPQPDLTPKGRSDVAAVDRYSRQRAAEDLTRQARSERPAGVVQADLSNVQVKRSLIPTEAEAIEQYSRRLSQDFPEPTASEMEALNAPSRTSKILARLGTSPQYRPDPKDINYPRFGPPSPEVAAARREQASQDLLRFAQQRQEDAALVTNQTMGALESGEDQMTGRTMMGVQRNEDLDASQVNNVARQTGSADVAASMTPDGVPVDQAEGVGNTIQMQSDPGSDLAQSSAARFLQKRRLELLGDPEAGTSTRLESKLAEAFGPDAWREDPKATRRRNALKLGAAGNEQFFENINEGTFTVGGEQFPVSLLKEGVFMEDTAQNLAERTNKYRDWLGNIRLQETNKQIRLGAELENLNAQDAGLMNTIQQLDAALEQRPASFGIPQQRDRYTQLKRDMQGALERQDELDIQMNQALREFELSERRLAGAQAATSRNIQKSAVPQKLASGIEEGVVIRPVLTAPDNIVLEEGELSNLERGRPVGDFISQEQLEVVPGGLLSGGRARSVSNIGADLGIDPSTGERITLPNINEETGETRVQKLAGKRMSANQETGEAEVNVRGRGGVAGLDTKSSIGIYGPELAEYGTAAMTKQGDYTVQATRQPSLTDTAVAVHKIRGYDAEGNPKYFNYPSSYEDPQAYKYTQEPTAQSVESFDVARQLRQLQQSGRPGEAQAFLDKIMKQRGISGTSGTFSRIN
jgi:cell envelope opacity-associated protein A